MASGKFTPGMKLKVQRTAKELRPTSVVTFMSQRREAVDEAYAGDIIGFTTHGGVQLGDTITDGSVSLQYTGLPFFAPELFMVVVLKNPLRTKQLQQGLAQLGEGAIQVFRPQIGGPMLLGAVGQLQFEVVQHRLKTEYDCDVRLEGCPYTGAAGSADTPAELKAFTDAYPQRLALDAANALAFLCTSPYDVRLAQERFPKIHFHLLREHAGLVYKALTEPAPARVRHGKIRESLGWKNTMKKSSVSRSLAAVLASTLLLAACGGGGGGGPRPPTSSQFSEGVAGCAVPRSGNSFFGPTSTRCTSGTARSREWIRTSTPPSRASTTTSTR